MSKNNAQASVRPLLLALALGAGGAVLGYLGARYALQVPGVRAHIEALDSWDLLAVPPMMLFVLAVHELGHLGAGIRRGMRFLLLIVGPFQIARTPDGLRFDWVFNLGTLGGVAAATPDPGRPALPQLRALVLGGPLASLALGLVAGGGSLLLEGRPGAYAFLIAVFSLVIAALTAIPMRAGGFMSDGLQFLELARGGESVRARLALVGLVAQSMGGTRPRELESEILERIDEFADRESLNVLTAHYFALLRAVDRGQIERAAASAHVLGERFDRYPDGFRQALAVELAIFHALCRSDAVSAADWMTRTRGGVVDPSRRALAEAAVATAQGRPEVAAAALARSRAALARAPDAGLRRLTSDQLDALARGPDDGGELALGRAA